MGDNLYSWTADVEELSREDVPDVSRDLYVISSSNTASSFPPYGFYTAVYKEISGTQC